MKIYPAHRKVVIPYRADVENLLGASIAQRFEVGGSWWLSIPHEIDTTRVLCNLGIKTPSPIGSYYDWAGDKPFDSQRATADMLTLSPRAYVLSEMGVGKTRAALYAFHYLKQLGLVNRLIVVAPLSTLVSVWENEIFEHFPDLTAAVLYGDAKKRRKILAIPADVYIINHEGIAVLSKELEARRDVDCMIIDELAAYRNRNARWKALMPLARRARYVWGMTGSPTPNEPCDAYGQVRLLTPDNITYSYTAFKEQVMRKITAFKWVERPEAAEIVRRVMSPQVRFVRAECFDLPDTTYSTRTVGMDPRAAVAYKKMFDELSVQVRQHKVTAANEGVKLSKLLQIAAGFVYNSEGKAQYVGGLDRIREVFRLVEQSSHKVIVFAPFRFYVDVLGKALGSKYSTAVIHGDVPKAKRDVIFQDFQKSDTPRIIVAHPKTMAHGLTLTAADTIIWALPITSLEIYQQANARITRSGQKHNTHIVHIEGSQVERHVYSRLQRKAKVQGALLDMFQQDTALLGGGASLSLDGG